MVPDLNLLLLDLGENAVDACLLARTALAAAQASGTPFRLVTVGSSEQERRAAELGVPVFDHCPTLRSVRRIIDALQPAEVAVTSARLWKAVAGLAARNQPGGKPLARVSLVAWSANATPLGQYPVEATLQLTDLATLDTPRVTPRQRHVLRAGIGLEDRELAIGLIGAWPQDGLVPPCTLFSRVIGMLALGGFPVVGVADGLHEDMHHAATFVRTVEDQFELIAIEGPVEAGLGAFDGVVWLNPDAGGWVAAMQSLMQGVAVVTIESPSARIVAGLAEALRAKDPAVGRMVIAPLATMASVGSRLMEVLGLVQRAPVQFAAAQFTAAHHARSHGVQVQEGTVLPLMSEGGSGS